MFAHGSAPMLLWIAIALLTGAASLAVLLPLVRGRRAGAAPDAVAVYKDQLREIEAEAAQGVLAPAEAEAARAEVARRLLAAARAEARTGSQAERSAAGAPGPAAAAARRRVAALVGLVGIPALALALYARLGAPGLPDEPLQARLQQRPENQDLATLIGRVEAHLAANPEDGRGWEVLAPVYLRVGRAADAVRAYENAIRRLGATPARETGLGEALVFREGGVVTQAARAAFEQALKAEAKDPKARYYLAWAKAQDGDLPAAVADWRALLAEAPPDAPWASVVEARLAQAEQAMGQGPERQAEARLSPGPSAEQVAAGAMDEAARRDMIQGMVARLAERLKTETQDVEGWLRLVRAYAVLDERDKAREATEAARRALGGNDTARARIDALARDLGLGG